MIERNTNVRWSNNIPHHPKSKELFDFIKKVDEENGHWFDWRCGGDGDNGEELMYQFDVYFETTEHKPSNLP
jgi:hypothetical protein